MTAFQNETNKQAAKRYFKTAKGDIQALEKNTQLGIVHSLFHVWEWCQENPKQFGKNMAKLALVVVACWLVAG